MRIIWTPEANQDRLDVQERIAIDNPRTAARMDQLFIDAVAKLAVFPNMASQARFQAPANSYRMKAIVLSMRPKGTRFGSWRSCTPPASASFWREGWHIRCQLGYLRRLTIRRSIAKRLVKDANQMRVLYKISTTKRLRKQMMPQCVPP